MKNLQVEMAIVWVMIVLVFASFAIGIVAP